MTGTAGPDRSAAFRELLVRCVARAVADGDGSAVDLLLLLVERRADGELLDALERAMADPAAAWRGPGVPGPRG
ncbi:hypothetical protein [Kitasatospora sp. NPDC088134]|uniref:hypothetical protein n=1 Tax=Kitasatospora sp. NPDC088134 TaxID=3364071 RepID=UPI00382CCB9A